MFLKILSDPPCKWLGDQPLLVQAVMMVIGRNHEQVTNDIRTTHTSWLNVRKWPDN
jgi:hypothetical protein